MQTENAVLGKEEQIDFYLPARFIYTHSAFTYFAWDPLFYERNFFVFIYIIYIYFPSIIWRHQCSVFF